MINIFIAAIIWAVFFVAGWYIGSTLDTIKKRIKEIEELLHKEKEEVGVTLGTYGVVDEYNHVNKTDTSVGIVEAKTPQRIEWEAKEALEKEARGLQ